MSLATQCINGVCSCVLPLDRNDWRPLALRHRSLAFVSALLLAVKMVTLLAIAVTPTTAELATITVSRVVQLTNAEREKAGRSALTVSPQLAAAAQRKGEDMLAHDYFAHISPSGVTPWFWMQQQNYAYQVAGENLAIDFVEVEDVVAAWLASPSHRDNMLHSAYTQTGVAVVTGEFQGGTSTIVVHMFGLPAGASAEAGPSPTPAPATAGTKQQVPPPAGGPTPTPSPTPLPTPVPDETAPRTPRIALPPDVGSVVVKILRLTVEAEADSQVTLLVNNTPVVTTAAHAAPVEFDLSQFADGELTIAAVSRDGAGNTSPTSNTLAVTKDSTGPTGVRALTAFVLSPQTDAPTVLASVNSGEVREIIVAQAGQEKSFAAGDSAALALADGEPAVTLTDELGNRSDAVTIALLPQYAVEPDSALSKPPARLNQVSRWLIGGVLMLLLSLLLVAVFVRISIQRPWMIAHTAGVLLLAAVLLFV